MSKSIDWFCKMVRIAGVNFPVAASFVQLQAELDGIAMSTYIKLGYLCNTNYVGE